MGTFATALLAYQSINLIAETSDAMEVAHEQIVELNLEQLDEGTKSDGNYLPPYAATTIRYKKERSQQYSVMNLKDTNAFRSKFYLSLSGNQYSINSSDIKTSELTDNYSSEIFGLTDYNKPAAWSILRPIVVQQLKTKLHA